MALHPRRKWSEGKTQYAIVHDSKLIQELFTVHVKTLDAETKISKMKNRKSSVVPQCEHVGPAKGKKKSIYLLLEPCELVPSNFLFIDLFLDEVAFFDPLGSSSMAISAKLRSSSSPVL